MALRPWSTIVEGCSAFQSNMLSTSARSTKSAESEQRQLGTEKFESDYDNVS